MRSFDSLTEREILALAISQEDDDSAGGGLGHTLPYLIPHVKTATWVAVVVALVELGVISRVRHRFMDSSLTSAIIQVVLGGVLVFLVGISIGSS